MGMTLKELKDALARTKRDREQAFAVFHQMLGAERQLELIVAQWEKPEKAEGSPVEEQTPAQ